MDSNPATLVGSLIAALSVLAGVIAYLWKRQEASHDKTIQDLDDCLERERKYLQGVTDEE